MTFLSPSCFVRAVAEEHRGEPGTAWRETPVRGRPRRSWSVTRTAARPSLSGHHGVSALRSVTPIFQQKDSQHLFTKDKTISPNIKNFCHFPQISLEVSDSQSKFGGRNVLNLCFRVRPAVEGADRESDTARLEENPSVTASATDRYKSSRVAGPRCVQSGVPGPAGAVSSNSR